MKDRILDLSERPARLSVRNGLLVISFREERPPPVIPANAGIQACGASPFLAVTPAKAGVHRMDSRLRGNDVNGGGNDEGGTGEERRSETPATKSYRSERPPDPNEQTVPLADIAVVIAAHPQISFSHAVLAGIAEAGGMFVVSNEKRMPCAMLLPLETHSTQTERFAAQASASVPLRKRVWQEIVQAQIRARARLLVERAGKDFGLAAMAARVRSGDPQNLEAQAARIYWRALFGDEFRRHAVVHLLDSRLRGNDNPDRRQKKNGGEVRSLDSDGVHRTPKIGDTAATTPSVIPAQAGIHDEDDGLNSCLNYGYGVLRAIVARALCAAGLHPALGLHHHNRYDTFCLADDLMEPFRPIVDRVVATACDHHGRGRACPPPLVPEEGRASPTPTPAAPSSCPHLDRDTKKAMLEGLLTRYDCDGESRTLFDWVSRAASSLAAVIEGREERIAIPALLPPGPSSDS